MDIEFDPAKEAANIAKHGLGFADFPGMAIVIVSLDDRFDYGEDRFNALGFVDGEVESVCFTLRKGRVRLISRRPASRAERKAINVS